MYGVEELEDLPHGILQFSFPATWAQARPPVPPWVALNFRTAALRVFQWTPSATTSNDFAT